MEVKSVVKSAMIALLVVKHNQSHPPLLVATLSDEKEITVFETAFDQGDLDPLKKVYDHRSERDKEEESFGNYVEELLSQPFLKAEIQEHGIQWLKSKIRIEQYQRIEVEAAKIIADYAFQVFLEQPEKTDFYLAGPSAKVRVRVFVVTTQLWPQIA